MLSACSRILNNMICLTNRCLHNDLRAKVQFPSSDTMQQFSVMVNHCEPTIHDVIEFVDGVSFRSKCTSEFITQNAFYCGYECNTTGHNVFAYGPDGKMFFYA